MRLIGVSLLLALCQISSAQDNFMFVHPANPQYFPDKMVEELFPKEKQIIDMGKMGDMPNTGLVRLRGFKPTDLDVAKPVVLDAATVVKTPDTVSLKDISAERATPSPFSDDDLLGNLKMSNINMGRMSVGMDNGGEKSEEIERLSGDRIAMAKEHSGEMETFKNLEEMIANEEKMNRKALEEQKMRIPEKPKKETLKSQVEKKRKFADLVNSAASPSNFDDNDDRESMERVGGMRPMMNVAGDIGGEVMEIESVRSQMKGNSGERVKTGVKPSTPARVITLGSGEGSRPRSNRQNLKLVKLSGTADIGDSFGDFGKSRASRLVTLPEKIDTKVYAKLPSSFHSKSTSGNANVGGKDFDPWDKGYKL